MDNKKVIYYIIGSIALFAIACLVVPKVTRKITNKAYKASVKKQNAEDEDDWGPELVKKNEE